MSHSNNLLADTSHPWLDSGATANPAPAPIVRDKDARESAAGCRERASADLVRALAMGTVNGRQVFEKSAASWTKRADMLQRIETGIETRLAGQALQTPELTEAEIAEDLALLRQ